MMPFVYEAQPARVVFAEGAFAELGAEAERMGIRRALVLATPEQCAEAETAAKLLGARAAGVFAKAAMHVPKPVAEAAVAEAKRRKADATVAIGGGSTTGLAKAIALALDLPILAVPTTYAGSEMTPIWGLTEDGIKRTGRDPRVLPRTVIYDPLLTRDLPAAIAGPSGMNAIAHCVEALYAENANPVISLMAEEGIRALGASLPRVVGSPSDISARSDALYGAWLSGMALGAVGMALHHKLCHTLGGSFDLPHADVHAVVIAHAAAYNSEAAAEAMRRIARALGADDAPTALFDLTRAVCPRTTLAEIGMSAADLDRAAALAVQNPYYNPRDVTRDGIRALLEDAYRGRRPRPRPTPETVSHIPSKGG